MLTPTRWADHDRPLRLRYGYHLYPTDSGEWMLTAPDDKFIRLRVPPEHVAALLPVLDGRIAPRDMFQAEHTRPLADMLEQFGQQGLLETGMQPTKQEAPTGTVLVSGKSPLAVMLVGLLEAAGVHATSNAQSALPELAPNVLVSCAEWLPDEHWQQLDAWCRQHQVAWHTCYAEGTRFYIGPMFVPSHAPSYADARARRRAAAPFHDELLACWRYLETSERVSPVRWPDTGALAMLAGALLVDVLAVLRGQNPPSMGYQLGFDPASGDWQKHPVLPVPHPLMSAMVAP